MKRWYRSCLWHLNRRPEADSRFEDAFWDPVFLETWMICAALKQAMLLQSKH